MVLLDFQDDPDEPIQVDEWFKASSSKNKYKYHPHLPYFKFEVVSQLERFQNFEIWYLVWYGTLFDF